MPSASPSLYLTALASSTWPLRRRTQPFWLIATVTGSRSIMSASSIAAASGSASMVVRRRPSGVLAAKCRLVSLSCSVIFAHFASSDLSSARSSFCSALSSLRSRLSSISSSLARLRSLMFRMASACTSVSSNALMSSAFGSFSNRTMRMTSSRLR